MKLRKLLAFLFMGAVLAGGFCSCGDDDDNLATNNTQGSQQNQQQGNQNQQQGNQQQGNQQGTQNNQQGNQSSTGLASLLKNTKWRGIVDCSEVVEVLWYDKDLNLFHKKELLDVHDTIYINFGVNVEYPTYTRHTYDRKTNKRYNSVDMWFDTFVEGNSLRLKFRSYVPSETEPGYRDIYTSGGKYFTREAGVEVELEQIK